MSVLHAVSPSGPSPPGAVRLSLPLHSRSVSSLFFGGYHNRTFPVVVINETPRTPPAGSSPPQLLLEDLARSSGLSEGVASVSLVSLYSIGGGVGKLGLGVMADMPRVDGVLLYALTVGVSGLAVLLLPRSR